MAASAIAVVFGFDAILRLRAPEPVHDFRRFRRRLFAADLGFLFREQLVFAVHDGGLQFVG